MLTRRPRKGDVVAWTSNFTGKEHQAVVGFATDDGLARDEKGVAMFIWGFGNDRSKLNNRITIVQDGPDVPDPRSSQSFLHNGTPYPPSTT